MPDRTQRTPYLVLALVAALVGLAFQGTRGLWQSTEGRYAECAREMLQTGNWLEPQLGGQPHWTKPPPTYWAIDAGMMLLGRNEWGARLYLAAAFIAATLAVAALARTFWDRRTAILAGLIYATSPFPVAAANSISTDMLLALWTLLVVLAYWKAVAAVAGSPDRPGRARLWIVAMWAFAGLAFATKGPPSLLVLAAVIVAHVWMRRRGRTLPRILSPVGIPLAAIIGLGWYLWAVLTHPGLLHYFLGDEVVGRIASDEFGRNSEWYMPFIMYLPVLALGAGLWTFFYPSILRRMWHAPRWRNLVDLVRRSDHALFLVLWLVPPLVIFSLAQSRLYLYVLPLFPAVALATARGTARLLDDRGFRKVCLVAGTTAVVAAIAVKALVAYWPTSKDERPFYQACVDAAGGDPACTHVALCDRLEKYGVEFYCDGRFTRLPFGAPQEELDLGVAELLHRMRAAPQAPVCVFSVYVDGDRMKAALDREGIRYENVPFGTKRHLFVVRDPSAAGS